MKPGLSSQSGFCPFESFDGVFVCEIGSGHYPAEADEVELAAQARLKGGQSSKKGTRQKAALKRMMELWRQGKLPPTLRTAECLLAPEGFQYGVLRRAAHKSIVLKKHFGLFKEGELEELGPNAILRALAEESEKRAGSPFEKAFRA